MTAQLPDLSRPYANAVRMLAATRPRLIGLAQAGQLIRADVWLYEATRRQLIKLGQMLQREGRLQGQLYFPPPMPFGAAISNDVPASGVMLRTRAYADQLRNTTLDMLAADPATRSMQGLQNEVKIVQYYVSEREYATGIAVPPPQSPVAAFLQTVLSPRAVTLAGLSAGLLLSTAVMADAASREQNLGQALERGVNLAREFLVGLQLPQPVAPSVVTATVIDSEPIPVARKCDSEDKACAEDAVFQPVQEAKL